jgi:hypothetical protein
MTEWKGDCHCGAIRIALPAPPVVLLECNCSLCRRTGWIGVYGDPAEVEVSDPEGAAVAYVQGDCMISVWHCRTCGIATHWTPLTASSDRMGINARIFPAELWQALPVQHVDGASF